MLQSSTQNIWNTKKGCRPDPAVTPRQGPHTHWEAHTLRSAGAVCRVQYLPAAAPRRRPCAGGSLSTTRGKGSPPLPPQRGGAVSLSTTRGAPRDSSRRAPRSILYPSADISIGRFSNAPGGLRAPRPRPQAQEAAGGRRRGPCRGWRGRPVRQGARGRGWVGSNSAQPGPRL